MLSRIVGVGAFGVKVVGLEAVGVKAVGVQDVVYWRWLVVAVAMMDYVGAGAVGSQHQFPSASWASALRLLSV